MHPDWLGSPHHFLAAAVVAVTIVWLAPRVLSADRWLIVGLAVAVAMLGEVLVEVVEYPLRYADDPNLTAYYDTIADLTSSLAGGLSGAVAATLLRRR